MKTTKDTKNTKRRSKEPLYLTDAKACPFCGRQPYLGEVADTDAPGGKFYVVECVKRNGCTVFPISTGDTPEAALRDWNVRIAPQSEVRRINQMHKRLLSCVGRLKEQNFAEMTIEDRLLRVALMAYVKHSTFEEADEIGWEELTDALLSAICNTVGEAAFCDWCERMRGPEVEP